MAMFKKGDAVICKKHKVSQRLVCDEKGMRLENYIDDYFFNREAVIESTYKECMEEHFKNELHEEFEDKDEYAIKFLDDGTTLAWVQADELVLKAPMDDLSNMVCADKKIMKESEVPQITSDLKFEFMDDRDWIKYTSSCEDFIEQMKTLVAKYSDNLPEKTTFLFKM